MKKILPIFLCLSMMICTASFAHNQTFLGDLNCFYSDTYVLYRMTVAPKMAWQVLSTNTFSQSSIDAYTEYAANEWTANGISITETADFGAANILVYAGHHNTMKLIDSELSSGEAGHTYRHFPDEEGMWRYNGIDIYGYKYNFSKVVLAWDSASGTQLYANDAIYKNILLHEVGHVLGWYGHSLNSADVMYEAAQSSRVNLTYRDVNHVKQVY